MSPIYYVAPGHETDGEPGAGYYFVGDNGEPRGPYLTREEARDAHDAWNAKRNAEEQS